MEKKLFAFFIPLCIIGFVGFWISTMFVGKYDVTISGTSSAKDTGGKNWYYSNKLENESFTAELLANPEIELNFSSVSAVVEPYDGTNIMVEVKNTSQSKLSVDLERNGDDSMRINIGTDTSVDFGFGLFKFNLFSDISDEISKRIVTVKVPRDYIYDKLIVTQGSGETTVTGIPAIENDIDIGSGTFIYDNSGNVNVMSHAFNIDLGSGEAFFNDISTREYEINLGSGKLNIEGLTGEGKIDMGSGFADIRFDDSPKGSLDMGSGTLKMTVPKDTNTTFNLDIGSGWVEIENGDHFERYGHLKDGDVVLGKGEFNYDIDLGSGIIDIAYAYSETEEVTEINVSTPGVVPGVVQSSMSQRESEEPA